MTNARESWSWNGCGGKKTKVEVYARADVVKLYIGTDCVGTKKLKNDCRAVFDVKYKDGTAIAIAYDKAGSELARTSLKTAGDATLLTLAPEQTAVGADELCYVRLLYTDETGQVKPLARGDIKVTVSGGTLLGLGSGCPYNERGFLTDTTDTYYGEALAIIKPEKGTIRVTAQSSFGNVETEILCR